MKIEPGTRFGRLTVVGEGPKRRERTTSICKCDCGTTCIKVNHELKRGDTRSCGCLHKEQLAERSTKHGMAGTRLHRIWKSMRTRANNPNFIGASRYCLRGISVCEEWNDFAVFRDWAIANGYEDNLTIDRIDNDRGYCPSNCRWITLRDQQSNRSTNIKIQYAGHEFPTLKKAAEFFGIPYKIAQHRWYVHRDLDIVFRKETK